MAVGTTHNGSDSFTFAITIIIYYRLSITFEFIFIFSIACISVSRCLPVLMCGRMIVLIWVHNSLHISHLYGIRKQKKRIHKCGIFRKFLILLLLRYKYLLDLCKLFINMWDVICICKLAMYNLYFIFFRKQIFPFVCLLYQHLSNIIAYNKKNVS